MIFTIMENMREHRQHKIKIEGMELEMSVEEANKYTGIVYSFPWVCICYKS